jgi:hypothetical protein
MLISQDTVESSSTALPEHRLDSEGSGERVVDSPFSCCVDDQLFQLLHLGAIELVHLDVGRQKLLAMLEFRRLESASEREGELTANRVACTTAEQLTRLLTLQSCSPNLLARLKVRRFAWWRAEARQPLFAHLGAADAEACYSDSHALPTLL